jgi:EF-hand domain pair
MINFVTNPSIGSSSGMAVAQRLGSESMFKKLDSEGKGYLTQVDLESAFVQISDAGNNAADAAGQAAEVFARMDADGDGRVTGTEFTAAEPKQQTQQGPKAAPSPGSSGGAPPQASESQEEYEPADANEDGQVTPQEQLAYDAAQALKAYQAVARAE